MEGDEDRDAVLHGPRCMDPADPATRNSCSALAKQFPPTQPEKQLLKMKAGQKKKGRREGGEQAEAAPRACKGQKLIYRPKRQSG
jgi:hypothetical protein